MALESATYISGLVSTNPTSSDNVGEGDNHLRLIKSTLLATFPNVAGAMTKTHTQLNTAVADTEAATSANTASTIVKRDASGNFTAGTVTANLTGNVTGNASTASAWSAARTITLGGDLTGSVSLDGSGNVTLSAQVNDDSHAHIISNVDGLQSALDGKLGAGANAVSASKWQTARSVTFSGGDVTGSFSIDGSVNVSNVDLQVVNDSHTHDGRYFTEGESDARYLGIGANAASASRWATARSLSLTGDVSGSTSFDGSTNASISVVVADNSHAHTISNVSGLQAALDGKLSTSGTAAYATRLATARSISLTGDASGSTTFDGSGNVSISVVVADSSHAHVISNVSGLQAALDAKLGSTATATNSTKWGGYNISTSATGTDASTIYFRT